MKLNIISGAAMVVLAFGTVPGFAQTTPAPSNQPTWTNEYNPQVKPPPAVFGYGSGGASAQQTSTPQYTQGSAQSLVPPAAMGQAEQTSKSQ